MLSEDGRLKGDLTVINWGDGSPVVSGTVSYNGSTGLFEVSGSHTYTGDTIPVGTTLESEGTAQITVSITHETEPTLTALSSATINEVQLTEVTAQTFTLSEGSATLTNAVVATFKDPGNLSGGQEDLGVELLVGQKTQEPLKCLRKIRPCRFKLRL